MSFAIALDDEGVLWLQSRTVVQPRRACRVICQASTSALVWSWAWDARDCREGDGEALGALVNGRTLPMAVLVQADQRDYWVQLAVRLALAGGVMGVFTDAQALQRWCARQGYLVAGEADWRVQVLASTLRRPAPVI